MRAHDYGPDVLSAGRRRRQVPEIPADPGLVVEDPATGFCGAVVRLENTTVVLEDRHGRHRVFPLAPAGFLIDGKTVTLVRPAPAMRTGRTRSASGSIKVDGLRARTARESRLWVEGLHDAELVERVWGHDLRVEGVVVEPLDGIDELSARVADFGPGPGRRLGVLVDHLVTGSKETRLIEAVRAVASSAGGHGNDHVLVTGHPYVDIWQAVKPASVGIDRWPTVPRGVPWKDGICAALGWGDPAEGWRRVLAGVHGFRDLEPALLGAVERLIDFVTDPGQP